MDLHIGKIWDPVLPHCNLKDVALNNTWAVEGTTDSNHTEAFYLTRRYKQWFKDLTEVTLQGQILKDQYEHYTT